MLFTVREEAVHVKIPNFCPGLRHTGLKQQTVLHNLQAEVEAAITKLKNGKASGPDEIPAEILKALKHQIAEELAVIMNKHLETGADFEIGDGMLVYLWKPGKSNEAGNFSPVILLDTVWKVFANVVLARIRPKIENFLPSSQTAYRSSHSTAENVFATKYIHSICQHFGEEYEMLALDLWKVFDTMARSKLLNLMPGLMDPDELRLIRKHLRNTRLKVKIGKDSTWFSTNTGTPQGDALSLTLFTVYLLAALAELCSAVSKFEEVVEMCYSDYTNFISKDPRIIDDIKTKAAQVLGRFNLVVNAQKTERHKIDKERNDQIKILGSFTDIKKEMKNRKQMAQAAFLHHHHVLTNEKLTASTRI